VLIDRAWSKGESGIGPDVAGGGRLHLWPFRVVGFCVSLDIEWLAWMGRCESWRNGGKRLGGGRRLGMMEVGD
jgi:hypothetical protein